MSAGVLADDWIVDPVLAARSLDLDPQRSRGAEARMRCPNGCDTSHKPAAYGASLCVSGERAGCWTCYRCGQGGHVGALLREGEAIPHRPRLVEQPAPLAPPLDMERAWGALAGLRSIYMEELALWAERRGWPGEVCEVFSRNLEGVCWAPARPVEDPDGERLRQAAYKVNRPLLVAIRDSAGVIRSAMRRWDGQEKSRGVLAKTMAVSGELCPRPEGAPRVLGQVLRAAEAARDGELVLLVEGEPDWIAASALSRLRPAVVGAVLGAPSCVGLRDVAEALSRALDALDVSHARVVVVPHLGDHERRGEDKMEGAAWALRSGQRLVSTLRLPSKQGKADLSDALVLLGVQGLCDLIAQVSPELLKTGSKSHLEIADSLVRVFQDQPQILARACWPVALYRSADGVSHGVRYRYTSAHGEVYFGALAASAWADKGAGAQAARAAAEVGVQIEPRRGAEWAFGLGEWASRKSDPERLTLTARPGWHREAQRRVYVNGGSIHGAHGKWAYSGPALRDERSGTLSEWTSAVEAVATTHGLRLALGCAFAASLVEPLGRDSFMVHMWTDSSSGKSRAGYLAASVWGSRRSWELKWSATVNRAEANLVPRTGALVLLDELKHMRERSDVSVFVHRLADGMGRQRMAENQAPRPDLRWSLVALSTGENSVASWLGDEAQGGHTVRAIDVDVSPEGGVSCCRSAAHADQIDQLVASLYGTAGDAWAGHLARLLPEDWDRLAQECAQFVEKHETKALGQAEAGRILRSLALLCVALREAQRAGIVRLPEDSADALLVWTLGRVLRSRGEKIGPRERALAILRDSYSAQPAHWPTDHDWRSSRGRPDVFGVCETRLVPSGVWGEEKRERTGRVFSTRAMLGASGVDRKAGVDLDRLLDWLCESRLAERYNDGGPARIGGVTGRWWVLRLEEPIPE